MLLLQQEICTKEITVFYFKLLGCKLWIVLSQIMFGEPGKLIFATVKSRFTYEMLKIQYSFVHSNATFDLCKKMVKIEIP